MSEKIALMALDELADPGSKSLTIDEQPCFLVHYRGQAYLYENHCPHLGIELNWQDDVFLDIEEQFIQCATHGALFLVENGECVAGPCLGQALKPRPCMVEDGVVYTTEENA